MNDEIVKSKIYKREKRQVKYMKEVNKRNLMIISTLIICLSLLIINNLKTNKEYNKLTYKLNTLEKKHIVEGSIDEEQSNKKDSQIVLNDEKVNKLKEKLNKLLMENENLKNSNKIITDDNISLQNSLKIAAMAGIKPRNYERPPEIASRAAIRRESYLGKFKGTAYTPSKDECGNNKGITYSGKPIVPGTTIAVDTRYWPIGTVFYVKGIGYVTAMDTGNKVKGKNRFDFAVFDRKFAFALGTRNWDVYLVKIGNGKVDIKFLEGN